jgi:hypothetical protein
VGVLLKYREDIDRLQGPALEQLLQEAAATQSN